MCEVMFYFIVYRLRETFFKNLIKFFDCRFSVNKICDYNSFTSY